MKSRLNSGSSWFAPVIVGVFCSFAAQANLIVNGGFESPLVPGSSEYRNGDELTGWDIYTSSEGVLHFNTDFYPVFEGVQAIYIPWGDSISQSVTTIPNQVYQLSFDLQSPIGAGVVEVQFGNKVEIVNSYAGNPNHYNMTYTADESITSLSFTCFERHYAYGNHPYLDNVVLSSVPIPPSVWLFGSGLIGLVGMARRKAA